MELIVGVAGGELKPHAGLNLFVGDLMPARNPSSRSPNLPLRVQIGWNPLGLTEPCPAPGRGNWLRPVSPNPFRLARLSAALCGAFNQGSNPHDHHTDHSPQ